MEIADFEKRIDYTFHDQKRLKQALNPRENKRLALLGDKVVGLLLIDGWYGTGSSCGNATRELQDDACNKKMAAEARHMGLHRVKVPGQAHGSLSIHQQATELEAVVGAVWIDSERDWDLTEKCYKRMKKGF